MCCSSAAPRRSWVITSARADSEKALVALLATLDLPRFKREESRLERRLHRSRAECSGSPPVGRTLEGRSRRTGPPFQHQEVGPRRLSGPLRSHGAVHHHVMRAHHVVMHHRRMHHPMVHHGMHHHVVMVHHHGLGRSGCDTGAESGRQCGADGDHAHSLHVSSPCADRYLRERGSLPTMIKYGAERERFQREGVCNVCRRATGPFTLRAGSSQKSVSA